MGSIVKLAEKFEKAVGKAVKKAEKKTAGVRADAMTLAAAVAGEAPGLVLQVKKAASRVSQRLADSKEPVQQTEFYSSKRKAQSSEKPAKKTAKSQSKKK